MNLTDKMAYLRGMVDGMELDLTKTKEGKVLGQVLEVMQEMTAYITDLQMQIDELTEVCESLDKDLEDVEDLLFNDGDEGIPDFSEYVFDENAAVEETDEGEEELYEAVCPFCNNVIALSDSALEEGEIFCPHCGEILEFDYSDLNMDTFEKPAETQTMEEE